MVRIFTKYINFQIILKSIEKWCEFFNLYQLKSLTLHLVLKLIVNGGGIIGVR